MITKQINKIAQIGLALTICVISNAQIIDNYGLRVGVGLSNQYWEYSDRFSDLSEWKDNKIGICVYLNAEKILNEFLSIRPEIGYIQKGFKEDITLTMFNGGEFISYNSKDDVVLHDLSINLAAKIIPFQAIFKPFIIAGVKGDYLLGYKDFEMEVEGRKFGFYESTLKDFKKIVFSGQFGIGLDYNDITYIEFEFNPAFSKNVEYAIYSIKDRYFEITIGLNINKLIKE